MTTGSCGFGLFERWGDHTSLEEGDGMPLPQVVITGSIPVGESLAKVIEQVIE